MLGKSKEGVVGAQVMMTILIDHDDDHDDHGDDGHLCDEKF